MPTDLALAELISRFEWPIMLTALLLAAGGVMLLSPLAKSVGWVDKPNLRKAHEGEIPLVGGGAVLIAMILAQMNAQTEGSLPAGYWTGAILLFTVSLIDDRYPIRARYRLAVQLVAAVAAMSLGGQMLPDLGDIFGLGGLSAWWVVATISILGTVALINATNFTDGADGLCAGIGFISLFWFVVAIVLASTLANSSGIEAAPQAKALIPLAASMMGALAGFLLFNLRTPWRRKAAVFLGDSGSVVIGYTLAWLAVSACASYGAASLRPVVCLWIVAVPLADAASCFVRRIMEGTTPMSADLKHLHHLLYRKGLTVAQAVFLINAGSFLCGLFGISCWLFGVADRWIFASFFFVLVVFVVATNLAWQRISYGSRAGLPQPEDDRGRVLGVD